MAERLVGTVVLITGASSGIGEASAIALAREGARLAIAARRRDRLPGPSWRRLDENSSPKV